MSKSSQPCHEKIIPSLATNHQDKDKSERDVLDAVHGSGDTGIQYANRLYKRRRSGSPFDPRDPRFTSTEKPSQSQKRARRVVANTPISSKANAKPFSSSQTQLSPLPFSESQPDASLVLPHFFPPPQLPVPSQSPLPFMRPDTPCAPPSPYRPPLPSPLPSHSSQPAWSGSWHTSAHSSTPSVPWSHSQPLHHSVADNRHHCSIPISNSAVRSLQLRTPMTDTHHWSPTSTPAPNTTRLYPQIFTPHSPFRTPTVVASSSSGGPYTGTGTYQHSITFPLPTPKEPVTPSQTPLPLSQHRQHMPPSGHSHQKIPPSGLFTPFPSLFPMVPPEDNHNIRKLSFN